jgi:hypothetical protein
LATPIGRWSGMSAAVITTCTPGRAFAAEVSIDLIRAWMRAERRILPYNWPGRLMSWM